MYFLLLLNRAIEGKTSLALHGATGIVKQRFWQGIKLPIVCVCPTNVKKIAAQFIPKRMLHTSSPNINSNIRYLHIYFLKNLTYLRSKERML